MTNDCKTCPVSTGTHKPTEAVHQIDEPKTQQPEALRLEAELVEPIDGFQEPTMLEAAAAAELRRLHARITELEQRLEIDPRHRYDGISARDATIEAQDERIAELESQLEAVGAGGVQRLAAAPQAVQAVQAAVPAVRGEVLVTVSGFTGSGKSVIAGEIEIMCRALGLQVEWPDGVTEKNMTHADWTTALELYKPRVRIVESNLLAAPAHPAEGEVQ